MGDKKVLPRFQIIGLRSKTDSLSVDGTMTGTTTITSPTIDASNLDNLGIEISWTGTPVGTIAVNCSISNSSWFPLTSFSQSLTQPSGSVGGYLISLNELPYPFVQVTYTNASGSGYLTVCAFGKDLN